MSNEDPPNKATQDQITAVMLQHGTERRLDASGAINGRYDSTHPHGRPLGRHAAGPRLSGAMGLPQPSIAAVAVMNAAGQILVGYSVKRAVWDVPQGVVEPGETVETAACRELEEETGISVSPVDLEEIAVFRHRTPEFVYPWETTLYIARCDDVSGASNREPDKCSQLLWCAPAQLHVPRGLSLRVLLTLLGR